MLAKGLIYDQPLSFTKRGEEWNINLWLEKIQWPMFLYIFEKKYILKCTQCVMMKHQFKKNALTMLVFFKKLKTTPTFETIDQNYVTSDAFDGSCGIELSVGTVYYMTGKIFYI